jgi:cold-inducible RNA-binding protein
MKKLFVGNLPHSTTEAELRTLFEPHGKVDQVSLVTDRDTGRSRGFAFVEMADAGEAEKAIAALNGKELGGRALNINEARPKTDRGFGGPRGGGRPGGGGGRPGGGGRSGGGGGGRDDYQGHARQPREPRW